MSLHFYKYHGTGNDFILVDNRNGSILEPSPEHVARLCHRNFGIGADGLILVEQAPGLDFRMRYYNADGNEGSMCGNGGRCTVALAYRLGLVQEDVRFEATDGVHQARILEQSEGKTYVALKMNDVASIETAQGGYLLDTGSPHLVLFRTGVHEMDVFHEGKAIRNSDVFRKTGVNVNFVDTGPGPFFMRTYERGVEAETLSCGTGTVATAIALFLEGRTEPGAPVKLKTPGGNLEVRFIPKGKVFTDTWLTGPAEFVFEGTIDLPAPL